MFASGLRLTAIALLIVSPALTLEAATISDDEFTKLWADSLSARLDGRKVEVTGSLQLEAESSTGSRFHFDLTNDIIDYRTEPATLTRRLSARVAVLTGHASFDVRLESLIPVVRNCRLLEQFNDDELSRLFHVPLNDELCLFYVIDDSLTMTFLTEKKALPYDSLFDLRVIALSNLRAKLPQVTRYDGETALMLTCGGDFEASLLLLDEYWNPETLPIKGEYVVTMPARDLLLVTGSDDSAGVDLLRHKADSLFHELSHPLSPSLFVRRNGKWLVYPE